jgi:predicted Zn-dependent protease
VNTERRQLVAEKLIASVRHALPKLANDPNAFLIGFTTTDMYPVGENWRFAFGWRVTELRAAVVSTARMDLHYPGEPLEDARPEIRLRKMVTKDIGILYYGLAQSSNSRSVLYNSILGIEELDAVGEQF